MSKNEIFENVVKGLEQAVEYIKGDKTKGRSTTIESSKDNKKDN